MIVIHMIMISLDTALYLFSLLNEDRELAEVTYYYRRYVVVPVYGISCIWLLGFSLWFFYVAHWIRKQAQIRQRAVQFAFISFIHSAAFAIEFGSELNTALQGERKPSISKEDIFLRIARCKDSGGSASKREQDSDSDYYPAW